MDLQGKVALITGARDDIGIATARRFLKEGAALVLDETAGDAAVDIRATVDKALAAHGRIDILVNAAAGPDDGCSWKDTDRAEWERQAAAGPARVFEWCRAVSPHMAGRRYGKIVNLAWSAGRYRSSYFPTGSSYRSGAAYVSGQGGILAFTRELASELAADGVYVNAVVPGLIETREGKRDWEQLSETAKSYILLESAVGRMGTPDEVAAVICFLASDRSSYITGTSIDVNGGWWMS
jgi:NAD(P)-dependent dehydrogenase (short-subunit alcohol dehydrogenase family)